MQRNLQCNFSNDIWRPRQSAMSLVSRFHPHHHSCRLTTQIAYSNISHDSNCVFGALVQYWLKHWLAPWSRVLENLTGFQLVKKFLPIYGTRRFISAFTSARHLSLSSARSIQSMLPQPISWRYVLILFSHLRLGLSSGFLPSGYPTKTLYTPLLFTIRATYPPISFFSIWSPEQCLVGSTDH